MRQTKSDLGTLVAIAAFSAILATMLHEHGGHALACVSLGGHLKELGAFYIECRPDSLTSRDQRIVTFSGPLASFLWGLIAMFCFGRVYRNNSQLKFFVWHFMTINLLMPAGYLLFSGVSNIGDFGLAENGVFYQAQPAWLIRVGLAATGAAAYFGVMRFSSRKMDTFIGGEKQERVDRAQSLSLIAWLAGGVAGLLIGFLNPHGIIIVLISSLASLIGGTSGMAWMMQMLDRKKVTGAEPFVLQRSWAWIAASAVFLAFYAAVLGPTIFIT
jgi:hypothetical protein